MGKYPVTILNVTVEQNDNHSSKQVTISLTIGKLITILNKESITNQTKKLVVRIQAEEGFDPNTDMDINSLRFGAPKKVNFGKGLSVKNIKRDGKNAIIPPIKPYERKTISIKTIVNQHETDSQQYLMLINKGKKDMVSFRSK